MLTIYPATVTASRARVSKTCSSPAPGFSPSQHLNREGVGSLRPHPGRRPRRWRRRPAAAVGCTTDGLERQEPPSPPAQAWLRPGPPVLGTDHVNIAYGHPAREGPLGDRVASFKPPARSQLWLKITPPREPRAAGMAGPCIKHGPVGFLALNGFIQSTRGERVRGGIAWLPGGAEQPRLRLGPQPPPPLCARHPDPHGSPHTGRPGAAPCSQGPPRPSSRPPFMEKEELPWWDPDGPGFESCFSPHSSCAQVFVGASPHR